jgi:surface antigen
MLLRVKALAPVTAALMMIAAAHAQLLPTWETHIVLSQADLDLIHSAVANKVHGQPVGTKATWTNPASGNSGSIKLVRKLIRNSQQCERIKYTVRSGGTPVYTEQYHFMSCLQADGTWKIA